ncbi:MAG: LamG-like jellyroll fold domain-containing protein, partial [Candidatus Heimdallarchaeaceae archaeon]
AYDATIGGGTVQSAIGVVLDGTADWVNIWTHTFGTDNFTIIMRVNPTAGSTSRVLISGSNDDTFYWTHDGNEGLIAGLASGSETSATALTMTTGSVNMIAVIRSGTTFRFFINGSFENETLTADFADSSDYISGSVSGYSRFIGTIRDYTIFSDAKSDAYITAFYNSGSYTDYEDGDPI